MRRKRKTNQSLSIRLGKAYTKLLSGVPFEKIGLIDSDKEKLNSYLKLSQSNLSAFQLAQATNGELSSTVCAELARVRKAHRRKNLEENLHFHADKKANRRKVAKII